MQPKSWPVPSMNREKYRSSHHIEDLSSRIICPPTIGAEFEDTYRRAVMIDGIAEPLRHLLFDFDDSRYTSGQVKDQYRDIVLGFRGRIGEYK